MQGLFNRAIQCFVCDTYGEPPWFSIVSRAGSPGLVAQMA